jgi:hypothetical protein
MGDLLGNILLSILAILLPPVAALIKVFNSNFYLNKSFSFKYSFRLDVQRIFGLMYY